LPAGARGNRPLRRPFPLLLALRYLRSARRDAFTSFLSAVAAGGIALGVAALVLALAALSGFQSALRGEILARTPQLTVEIPSAKDVARFKARIESQPGVVSSERVRQGRGWLIGRGRAQPVEIVGFENRLPPSFPSASAQGQGLYLSDTLARAWGLERGDWLSLASSRPTLTPLGPEPRVRRLRLVGTFHAGRTEQLERVAIPLPAALDLLGAGTVRFEVETKSLERALRVAPALATILPPGSRVRTWKDLNAPLFFALHLEKGVMFVGVFLIVLVAAIALVSDLSLIIAKKRSEIGILGAMGATPETLRQGFVLLGAMLAALGVGLGAGLGIAASWLLERERLIRLPGRVYFLDYVPFRLEGGDLVLVISLTLMLALGCTLIGAARVTRLDPIEALRR